MARWRPWIIAGLLVAIAAALTGGWLRIRAARAQAERPPATGSPAMQLPQQRRAAPAFPKGFAWWNSDRPLSLDPDLRGQVIVLEFWTYCCINCMHMIAELEKVEAHYHGAPLAIIGVHSNKFENEGEAENIRQAILRYRITHPVLVDESMAVWNAYGVNSWPTLVFIDPQGQVVGALAGEAPAQDIIAIVGVIMDEARARGTLAAAPLALRAESRVPSASGLAFPGKVAADARGTRLFVADSNHDRVLVLDPEGRVLHTIGSGRRGQADGAFADAKFFNPQGLAFDDATGFLYIADTDNHLIRRADLSAAAGRVETILGAGRQVYDREGGNAGRAQGLNSPWDLALREGRLYIAMAGTHQLWRMDLASDRAEAWVGSGLENIKDGPGPNAALAQPSGLALLGDWLYFADSEVSALRQARLATGEVNTLIGHGLFDFGDVDGAWGRARLQHPLGLATDGASLFVADTYNHKIKRLDLAARTIATLAGTGQPGAGEPGGPLQLHEPGGLAWAGGALIVADTNNHRLVRIDPANPQAWRELPLRFPDPKAADVQTSGTPDAQLRLRPGAGRLAIEIEPGLAEGFHLSPLAPQTLRLAEPPAAAAAGQSLLPGAMAQQTLHAEALPLRFEIALATGLAAPQGRLVAELSFGSCTEADRGLCRPEQRRWLIAWTHDQAGTNTLRLSER